MDAAQAPRRQQEPPARGRVAAPYVGPVGVYLGELDLGAGQALLGRRQQPPDRLRPVAFDGIAVVVDAVVVKDAEIALRAGVARLVGSTCQGCHLTIPATEVDRIRRQPAGTLAFCDNCGAILVP